MASFDSQSKLIIHLFIESLRVKTVVVTKNSSISVLDKVCKSDNFLPNYIHKGILLSKHLQFRTFDIESEACIYVTNNVAKYFSNKKGLDELMNQIKSDTRCSNIQIKALRAANNGFRNEMDRLNDLYKVRNETMMIRAMKRSILNEQNIPIKKQDNPFSIPSSELSREALPKFW